MRTTRRGASYRAVADTRLVWVEDGPSAGGRMFEIRAGRRALDVALDRGADIARLAYRGDELGWLGPTLAPTRARPPDIEDGLGTMRAFDGFLVTCGLDHHGVPARSDASGFCYPPRGGNVHPLHGRIVGASASLAEHGFNEEAA